MAIQNVNKKKIKKLESLLGKPKLFFGWFWQNFIKNVFQSSFLKNELVDWLLLANFLANLAIWILLAFFIRPVDMDIILHYNVYFGVDVMGNWKQVFLLPFVGLILLIINTILAVYFFQREKIVVSYILLLATLMVQMNLIVASISIIIVNH
jgi:hypothetical protein